MKGMRTMENKLALKPCPLCNSRVNYNFNSDFEPDGVACQNCHYILRFMRIKHQKGTTCEATLTKIAEAWNRRAFEPLINITEEVRRNRIAEE